MEYLNFKLPPNETFLKKENCFDHQKHMYYEAIKHCTQFRNAVDVGAHIGLFSSKMVNDFNHVYSFEPMFHDCLRENVTADNITIHELGLSNRKISYKFKVKESHTGMSKIDPNGEHRINCDMLDSYNLKDVDLIKIDTEHHEKYVLQGATKFFENNSPVIIIEINDTFVRKEIFDQLSKYNYSVIKQDNCDFILKKGN